MGDGRGLAIGIDVGGTKLAAGLVTAEGEVLARLRRETPARNADAIVPLVAEVVEELTAGQDGAGLPVGVGAAGMVDLDGVVRYAPNIDWRDYPLLAELRKVVAAPVTVDNDAAVAAWGEYRIGAGRSAGASMVMLTVGTGVGGGLILGDRMVRGATGMAAELGHMIVVEGGPQCPCGNRGCLEAVASGSAIGRFARERADAGDIPTSSALATVPRDDLDGKAVTRAAAGGDELAGELIACCGRWLGIGILGAVHAFDPELVVVGGGAMEAGELLLAPAREVLSERLLGRGHRQAPAVVPAALGDAAGVVGAALLALEAV